MIKKKKLLWIVGIILVIFAILVALVLKSDFGIDYRPGATTVTSNYAKEKNDVDVGSLKDREAYPNKGVRVGSATLGSSSETNIDLEKATLVRVSGSNLEIDNKTTTNTIYLDQNQLTKITKMLNIIWEVSKPALANKDKQCTDLYRDFILTDGNYSKSLHYNCPVENKTVKELDAYIRSIKQ